MKQPIAILLLFLSACCCAQNDALPYQFYRWSHIGTLTKNEKRAVYQTLCLKDDSSIFYFIPQLLREQDGWALLDVDGESAEGRSFSLEPGECLSLEISLLTGQEGKASASLRIQCPSNQGNMQNCDRVYPIEAQVINPAVQVKESDNQLDWMGRFELPESTEHIFFRKNQELWIRTTDFQIRRFRLTRSTPDLYHPGGLGSRTILGNQLCDTQDTFLVADSGTNQFTIRNDAGEIVSSNVYPSCPTPVSGCSAAGEFYILCATNNTLHRYRPGSVQPTPLPIENASGTPVTLFGLTTNLLATATANASALVMHQLTSSNSNESDSVFTELRGSPLLGGIHADGQPGRIYLAGTSGTQIARFDIANGIINRIYQYDHPQLSNNRGLTASSEGMLAVLADNGKTVEVFREASAASSEGGKPFLITLILAGMTLIWFGL